MLDVIIGGLCSVGLYAAYFLLFCFLYYLAMIPYYRFVSRTSAPKTIKWPKTGDVFTYPNHDQLAEFVAVEMFERGAYLIHGVELPPKGAKPAEKEKPLIIDIGGHIGLFSQKVAQKFERFDIVAFEPVPGLCEFARKNLSRIGAKSYDNDRNYVLVNQGLSDAKGTFPIRFDWTSTAGASISPGDADLERFGLSIIDIAGALIRDRCSIGREIVGWQFYFWLVVGWLLKGNSLLRFIGVLLVLPRLILHTIERIADPKKIVDFDISLTTLPAALAEVAAEAKTRGDGKSCAGINDPKRPIALMKIDCEGAEEKVLIGLDDATWARTQQFVIEVSDIEGRMASIIKRLEDHGFSVTVGPAEDDFELQRILAIRTLYAVRKH